MNEREQSALCGTIMRLLEELIQQADEFNFDRDSYVQVAADTFHTMAAISTFKSYGN